MDTFYRKAQTNPEKDEVRSCSFLYSFKIAKLGT